MIPVKRVGSACLFLLLGLLLGAIVSGWYQSIVYQLELPDPGLPSFQDIASMQAKLYDTSWGDPETPWFSIPKEEYGAILYGLVPFRDYDDYKWPRRLVGEIRVTLIYTGEVKNIQFFDSGKNPLVYSVNRVRFMTKRPMLAVDEAAWLHGRLMRVHDPNLEFLNEHTPLSGEK